MSSGRPSNGQRAPATREALGDLLQAAATRTQLVPPLRIRPAMRPTAEAEDTAEVAAGEGRLWFEVNDVAELTFDTGETIVGLWTRPRGTHAGWVLTDGTRLRARPRTLVHISIVYPPDRIAEESVTHDDHTTEPEPDPDDA